MPAWTLDRVQDVIDKITDGIKNGKITSQLSPSVLEDQGGEIGLFYSAALRREYRPEWAKILFPSTENDLSGFNSFVEYIQSQLATEAVHNAKSYVQPYVSHTHDELQILDKFENDVKTGNLTREGALRIVTEEYSIRLSATQISRRFPVFTMQHRTEGNTLEKKLQDFRKNTDFDLSQPQCVRGYLFEALIGVRLSEIHGADQLQDQRRISISYKDLDDVKHHFVFPDFVIGSDVFEVKWRNSLENILESVLPQFCGMQSALGTMPSITVICRAKLPDIVAMMSTDCLVTEYAEAMGIHTHALRLQTLFNYISIDEFLVGQDTQFYFRAIEIMDSLNDINDVSLMRNLTKALTHLYKNGNSIPEKLQIVVEHLGRKVPIPRDQFECLLGPLPEGAVVNPNYTSRQKIIATQTRGNRQQIQVAIYNKIFSSMLSNLKPAQQRQLACVPEYVYQTAAMQVFEDRKSRRARLIYSHISELNHFDLHQRVRQKKLESERRHLDSLIRWSKASMYFSESSVAMLEATSALLYEIGSRQNTGLTKQLHGVLLQNRLYTGSLPALLEELGAWTRAANEIGECDNVTDSRLQNWLVGMKGSLHGKIDSHSFFYQAWASLKEISDKMIGDSTQTNVLESAVVKAITDAQKLIDEKKLKAPRIVRDTIQTLYCNSQMPYHRLQTRSLDNFLATLVYISHVNYNRATDILQRAVSGANIESRPLAFDLDKCLLKELEVEWSYHNHFIRMANYVSDRRLDLERDKGDYVTNELVDFVESIFLHFHLSSSEKVSEIVKQMGQLGLSNDLAGFDAKITSYERAIYYCSRVVISDLMGMPLITEYRATKGGKKPIASDFLASHSDEIFVFSEDQRLLNSRLALDYLWSKLLRVRVIATVNQNHAPNYLRNCLPESSPGSMPWNQFREYISELEQKDKELFIALQG